jgi:hypothetical protein
MKRLLVLLVPLALAVTGCAAEAPSAQPGDQGPSISAVTAVERTPASEPKPAAKPARPTSFRMWKFDAPVVPLRLSGSELVPPDDPSVLGWWGKPAGAPAGTTLLTGHTVHTGGGELDDLELTPVGSQARVSGVVYEVESVQIMSKAELARRSSELFSQDGKPKLVVVTCEGYDSNTGEYSENVVVTATPRAATT